jgi:regulator of extracellular matrix RemA (YlzA/DUF370 family)
MSNRTNGILAAERFGRTLNVGHGNFVLVERIVMILESGPLPMKRMRC